MTIGDSGFFQAKFMSVALRNVFPWEFIEVAGGSVSLKHVFTQTTAIVRMLKQGNI